MNDLQANDAAEIARSISKDFAKYLAKYDEKKYPPEILLRLQEQFAYPKMVSGSDLRTALVWKYGHWGKPRIPAAHERLAKRISELWISVPSEMMLTSAKTFFMVERTARKDCIHHHVFSLAFVVQQRHSHS